MLMYPERWLALSTLIWLFTLETCCGYRYGQARNSLRLRRIFTDHEEAHETPQEPRCFTETTSLSQAEPFPGIRTPKPEKRTLARTSRSVYDFVCVAALDQDPVKDLGHLRVLVREY